MYLQIEQIESVVTQVTGVTIDEVKSKGRGPRNQISLARGFIMYFVFHRTPLTLREIFVKYEMTRESCQNAIEKVQGGKHTALKHTFDQISLQLTTPS